MKTHDPRMLRLVSGGFRWLQSEELVCCTLVFDLHGSSVVFGPPRTEVKLSMLSAFYTSRGPSKHKLYEG